MTLWDTSYRLEIYSWNSGMTRMAIQQDNSGAITIYKQGWSYSNKSRHIRTKYFYVVEQMEEGVISTPTDRMISDGLTKPITGKAFRENREIIGVRDL